ncbi:MAG: PEP-CTERM sorting domain-containing protein [bacterium]
MKKIIVLLSVLMLATTIRADISVNWTSTGASYDSAGTFATSDRYIQLLWSSADPVAVNAVWGSPNYLAAGEYQLYGGAVGSWANFATDLDGNVTYANTAVGGQTITAGYLYVRIFESSTILDSTKYYQSTAIAPTLPTYDSLNPSTTINYDCTSGNLVTPSTAMVAVPEPSTIGLLLVGAGLVAFRRFRKA